MQYFVKAGYRCRDANRTVAGEGVSDFWTPTRIQMAALYQYQVYRHARDLIRLEELRSVIDLGCGPGSKLHELIAPVCPDVVGVDQESAISYCRATWSFGSFHVDDLEHPTLSFGRAFDMVICSDVLEHLLDPDPLMGHIREELCHAETYVVLSTPDRDQARGRGCMESPKPEHVREWNSAEFRRYVERCGFVVLEQRLVLPLKFTWSVGDLRMIWSQLRRGRDPRSCQLVVCRSQ